jgi:hypothetical protein
MEPAKSRCIVVNQPTFLCTCKQNKHQPHTCYGVGGKVQLFQATKEFEFCWHGRELETPIGALPLNGLNLSPVVHLIHHVVQRSASFHVAERVAFEVEPVCGAEQLEERLGEGACVRGDEAIELRNATMDYCTCSLLPAVTHHQTCSSPDLISPASLLPQQPCPIQHHTFSANGRRKGS